MSKIFLDTNVLVYAVDAGSPAKQRQIRRLLRSTARGDPKVISTQVLQEFYVVAVKKLGMDPMAAKELLSSWLHFEVVGVDSDVIKDAVDCSVLNRLSLWDALIVVSAERARCAVLWTEDMADRRVIRGVRIENPFKEGYVREESAEYAIARKRAKKRRLARTS